MKHDVTSDCMCSINVAFNIKTGEIFFWRRILSFETFFELTFSFLCNSTRDTHKDRLCGSDGTEA